MQNHKELSSGAFDSLNVNQKEFVMECAGWFHYRNGKNNPDGSAGEINISPGELNNILAYTLKHNNRIHKDAETAPHLMISVEIKIKPVTWHGRASMAGKYFVAAWYFLLGRQVNMSFLGAPQQLNTAEPQGGAASENPLPVCPGPAD